MLDSRFECEIEVGGECLDGRASVFESTGRSATFSPELAELTIYVISLCQGEKIPRKGGPAITRSDQLVVNKADLAPHIGADLEVMEHDTQAARGGRPYVFTDLPRRRGLDEIIRFLVVNGGLRE